MSAYRLAEGEPLPEGIARIARGRIGHAVDELSGKTDSSAEKAVHEARKDMKKLRALLRLVRGELGEEVYRRENGFFRDAAARLSSVRDADVMIATLDGLDDVPADAARELRRALRAHRRSLAAQAEGDPAKEVARLLRQARRRVRDWPLERDGFEVIEPGLRRMYRRGRRDFRTCRKRPDTEALHDWRKRAKDLWYHATLIEGAWPAALKALGDQAHELSDRLGDDHDLAVLHDWAEEHAGGLDRRVARAVARRRAELQGEALDLGARLYAERASAFVDRLEAYFNAWRQPVAHSS